MHSPNHLFIVPGALLAGLGTLIVVVVGAGLDFFGRAWGVHALIGGALLMIVGTQVLALGCARTPTAPTSWASRTRGSTACARAFASSTACCSAACSCSSALVMGGLILATWISHGFGSLADEHLAVIAATLADRRHPDLLLLLPAVASSACAAADVRVRVVLAVALALVAGALALDMSARAPRLAGTDHTSPVSFVATLQSGQELCQPGMVLPSDAARVQVLVGTYGAPVPQLSTRFLGAGSRVLAAGRLPAGAPQGEVTIPFSFHRGGSAAGTLCMLVEGGKKTVLAGNAFTAGTDSEQIAGVPQPGRISIVYLRAGSESWWQLLPALSRRFGLGKASFFGDWTLAAVALLLLGVWVATVRLLRRELT